MAASSDARLPTRGNLFVAQSELWHTGGKGKGLLAQFDARSETWLPDASASMQVGVPGPAGDTVLGMETFDAKSEAWHATVADWPGQPSPLAGASPMAESMKLEKDQEMPQRIVYGVLMLVGAGVSVIAFAILCVVTLVSHLQTGATQAVARDYGEYAAGVTWVVFSTALVACAYLATCTVPQAVGSGIPETKVEIRGLRLQDFFVFRVLAAKAVGLALSQGAGLPVGKEGPFVHFAACVSNLTLHSKRWGPYILRLRTTLLTASVAVGVGHSFSVPIAGVLFALEVMPDTAWHNTTYWSCLAAALAGSVTARMLSSAVKVHDVDGLEGPLLPPVVAQDLNGSLAPAADPGSTLWLLALSVLLGLICGRLGPLFIMSQQATGRRFNRWRLGKHAPPPSRFIWSYGDWAQAEPEHEEIKERLGTTHTSDQSPILVKKTDTGNEPLLQKEEVKEWMSPRTRSLLLCISVAALNSTLAYLMPLLRDYQSPLMSHLFSCKPLDWATSAKGSAAEIGFWKDHSPFLAIGAAILMKFFMTIMALSLPLPNGCIAPVYVLGALIGRLFGMTVELAGVSLGIWEAGGQLLAAHFALVGAAAFCSSVCRSFSIAVAIYELAPLVAMELPIASATIVAILVANYHGPSIFDAILTAKKLPAPLQFRTFRSSLLPVSSVMRKDVPTVLRFGTVADIDDALARHPRSGFFAVVNKAGKSGDTELGHLEGAITKSHLLSTRNWLETATLEEANAELERTSYFTFFTQDKVPKEKVADICQDVRTGDHNAVTPLQVQATTPLENVAVLFIIHRCEIAFVTEDGGALKGMVLAGDLQQLQK